MTNSDNQLEQECFYEKNIHYVCNKLENIEEKNMFYIFLYCLMMYHVFEEIEKQIVLKLNYFSEHRRKEFMMCLYFLNIDKNYKNHMSLNLTNEV